MKKVNSQLLLVCALFIFLVVLCYSWVSTEMFQSTRISSTSVASNNMNRNMNRSRAIEQYNVTPVMGSHNTKSGPSGFDGLSYFQDFTKHVNTTNMPRQ